MGNGKRCRDVIVDLGRVCLFIRSCFFGFLVILGSQAGCQVLLLAEIIEPYAHKPLREYESGSDEGESD